MDAALLTDLYELTMAECYFRSRRTAEATFDLFVRGSPGCRSYLVAAGLSDVLEYIRGLRFDKSQLAYLRSLCLFSEEFLGYLSDFSFTGDVWAMEEGTVFFPNEPLIRVTAPLIAAQLVEAFLLNTVNVQTMLATKAHRVAVAARGRSVFDFSLRRTHGSAAGLAAARSSYIAGFAGTSNVLAGKRYGIPVAGTMAHSFVMSFESERESFRVYSRSFPDRTTLLVDTYDTINGIRHAISVGRSLAKRGHRLAAIRIDSGDIAAVAKTARRMLDAAGLGTVQIVASGNLDEFKIGEILACGAPVDSFGVGTHMGTSSDAPFLDVIYKLSEVTDGRGRFMPTMKLSARKVTYPGRKQVFRQSGARGSYTADIVALETEKPGGEALLKRVVRRGKVEYDSPRLEDVRARLGREFEKFPLFLKDLYTKTKYPVIISPGLAQLTRKVMRRLSKR